MGGLSCKGRCAMHAEVEFAGVGQRGHPQKDDRTWLAGRQPMRVAGEDE
jgi:hypothetical protein